MTVPHTLIARIAAKPGHTESMKAELLKMLKPTHQEDGCVDYVLHQDNENPAVFWFYENWTSPEHLKAHTNTAHFRAMFDAITPLAEEVSLNEMTRLEG